MIIIWIFTILAKHNNRSSGKEHKKVNRLNQKYAQNQVLRVFPGSNKRIDPLASLNCFNHPFLSLEEGIDTDHDNYK